MNAAGTSVQRREATVDSIFSAIDTQTEAVLKFDTLGLSHTALFGFEYANGFRHPTRSRGPCPP